MHCDMKIKIDERKRFCGLCYQPNELRWRNIEYYRKQIVPQIQYNWPIGMGMICHHFVIFFVNIFIEKSQVAAICARLLWQLVGKYAVQLNADV